MPPSGGDNESVQDRPSIWTLNIRTKPSMKKYWGHKEMSWNAILPHREISDLTPFLNEIRMTDRRSQTNVDASMVVSSRSKNGTNWPELFMWGVIPAGNKPMEYIKEKLKDFIILANHSGSKWLYSRSLEHIPGLSKEVKHIPSEPENDGIYWTILKLIPGNAMIKYGHRLSAIFRDESIKEILGIVYANDSNDATEYTAEILEFAGVAL